MTPGNRREIGAGLDLLRNVVKNIPSSPLSSLFGPVPPEGLEIAAAAIDLAKELVDAGHEDPAGELRRLRGSIQAAWQEALDKKFKRG